MGWEISNSVWSRLMWRYGKLDLGDIYTQGNGLGSFCSPVIWLFSSVMG